MADGTTASYIISKFPAVAGREIVTQYPVSAIPKLGDYGVNEELMLKLMCFVGVTTEAGTVQNLSTRMLVDNHVPDFETLMKIEMAMMEYNCSFFAQGKVSNVLEGLFSKAKALIMPMLTDYAARSSRND